MQSPGQVTLWSVEISFEKDQQVQAKQFKMKFLIIFAFLVYIQNVQGSFDPYQRHYWKEVQGSWPYNPYYHLVYPLQPQQFPVSLFLEATSIICNNSIQDKNNCSYDSGFLQKILQK